MKGVKSMKKSDLKTGMRVTLRSGKIYMVLLGFSHRYSEETDVLVNPFGERDWTSLRWFCEDLKNEEYSSNDIVKIEEPDHVFALFREDYKYTTIWERPDPKKMTLEQIEKELGYPVKIVGMQS